MKMELSEACCKKGVAVNLISRIIVSRPALLLSTVFFTHTVYEIELIFAKNAKDFPSVI